MSPVKKSRLSMRVPMDVVPGGSGARVTAISPCNFAVDVSAEGFAVVGSGDGVPAIERMKMRGIAGDGDAMLFRRAAAEIDADGVEAPLLVDDSDLEHAA